MRGGNHSHIGFDRTVTTDPIKTAVAEHAQQAGLQVEFHVADFIEKQGAAVGLFKATATHALCPCERPAFMTKQFAFKQVLGDRRRVDGHKRTRSTL